MKNIQQQMAREVRWAFWLTLIYLVGWIVCAYFSPNGRGWLGFPLWFELACVYLPIAFTLLAYGVIKKVYKEIVLDEKQ
ncbi:DUF997 family protein [Ursidibacter maritimus]|uniref:DUF997 family protein n=1 Tax=Ursidibacter maritimus TaxID=1331689 RepID=A0A949T6Q3_9PAST|nr:DUF997 family protein [Ursidibacter maritimus]KAE9538355.1 hypothetical protein A1D26_05785 [Ursidibacter maritimus]MBV6523402.1 DUF997 family protein [Ursidibacter maritimus]MBV6525913.1 DUF997 family protein [Ursidibacter maritimus]MBV6528253.1 DUF997 family protein [Ursidibacter maritimus]MBV6529384.1 DUF997 family protein [Ursidibacter maritimus]